MWIQQCYIKETQSKNKGNCSTRKRTELIMSLTFCSSHHKLNSQDHHIHIVVPYIFIETQPWQHTRTHTAVQLASCWRLQWRATSEHMWKCGGGQACLIITFGSNTIIGWSCVSYEVIFLCIWIIDCSQGVMRISTNMTNVFEDYHQPCL